MEKASGHFAVNDVFQRREPRLKFSIRKVTAGKLTTWCGYDRTADFKFFNLLQSTRGEQIETNSFRCSGGTELPGFS